MAKNAIRNTKNSGGNITKKNTAITREQSGSKSNASHVIGKVLLIARWLDRVENFTDSEFIRQSYEYLATSPFVQWLIDIIQSLNL